MPSSTQLNIDCSDGRCGHISCNATNLRPGRRWFLVQIESYLVAETLIKEGIHRGSVSTAAIAQIQDIGFNLKLKRTSSANIATTNIRSVESPQTADQIPWWIWVIAVLAAIVFLLLIALLLWRLGFFKRNRPPKEQALLAHPPEHEFYGYPKYGEHL